MRRASAAGSARARTAVALALLAVAVAGCGGRSRAPAPADPRRPPVRVASFDFSESQVLAALYGQALAGHGYPVEPVDALGPREIVEPALQQGQVDFVPEYLGSALDFVSNGERVASADAARTRARLARALRASGVTVLGYARAQDQNGVAVTRRTAATRGLRRISDLAPVASGLVFGGPPECPQRPLCLQGLQGAYGVAFKRFLPMPSFAVTAAALRQGQIDAGMLITTDGDLADGDLVLLADDRHLQPAENVVPVVRDRIVVAYGPALVAVVNQVTAQLTNADLVELNRQVALGERPDAVADAWLRRHGLAG